MWIRRWRPDHCMARSNIMGANFRGPPYSLCKTFCVFLPAQLLLCIVSIISSSSPLFFCAASSSSSYILRILFDDFDEYAISPLKNKRPPILAKYFGSSNHRSTPLRVHIFPSFANYSRNEKPKKKKDTKRLWKKITKQKKQLRRWLIRNLEAQKMGWTWQQKRKLTMTNTT